jgi:hypothetical protein
MRAGGAGAMLAAVSAALILAALAAPARANTSAAKAPPTTAPSTPQELGEAIYHGHAAMPGRIRGHELTLPTQATRCINCHVGTRPPVLPSIPNATTQTFGPSLHADHLTRALPRRGGPPTRYDADSLCTLLRNGMDPAKIQMPRTMPLYEITNEQCQALWTYLTSRKPGS